MYIHVALSSDHSLLTLNMLFNVILKKFEVPFYDSWSENDALIKRLMKIHSIHQYYIMALRPPSLLPPPPQKKVFQFCNAIS